MYQSTYLIYKALDFGVSGFVYQDVGQYCGSADFRVIRENFSSIIYVILNAILNRIRHSTKLYP